MVREVVNREDEVVEREVEEVEKENQNKRDIKLSFLHLFL